MPLVPCDNAADDKTGVVIGQSRMDFIRCLVPWCAGVITASCRGIIYGADFARKRQDHAHDQNGDTVIAGYALPAPS